jgi:hypothetical protein
MCVRHLFNGVSERNTTRKAYRQSVKHAVPWARFFFFLSYLTGMFQQFGYLYSHAPTRVQGCRLAMTLAGAKKDISVE